MNNILSWWDGTASGYGTVTANAVNVRAFPMLDSQIDGVVNAGDEVLIWCEYRNLLPVKPEDAWYLAHVNSITGWISQSYVKLGV